MLRLLRSTLNKSSIHGVVKKTFMPVLLSHLKPCQLWSQSVMNACLRWDRHYIYGWRHERNMCSSGEQCVVKKVLSLQEDVSRGSLETSDIKLFTAVRESYTDSRIRLN